LFNLGNEKVEDKNIYSFIDDAKIIEKEIKKKFKKSFERIGKKSKEKINNSFFFF
jgi:hypothetical protein